MRSLTLLCLNLPGIVGFIFPEPISVWPSLKDVVNAQKDARLKIGLEIGQEGHQSRLAISGMVLDLHNDVADYERVKLPGVNGPHPKLSSGARKLSLQQEGQFVGAMGNQVVKMLKGCWEMVWKKDAPAGALLCGFEVPEEYKRNDASLPKGRVYVSFPVWTKDGLSVGRSEKERIMKRAKEFLEERNGELEKMKETNNLLMKALHYRNAYAATENYWLQPLKDLRHVPEDHEIIKLQDDLLLTTKGLVWSKALPHGEQILLGTATISPGAIEGQA